MFRKTLLILTMVAFSLMIVEARPLAQIEASGILKVGVPADYAPLASYDDDTLVGFDVDVAKAVAIQWQLKVEFVTTSRSSIEEDLAQDKFDIAMGGISFTPERNEDFQLTKFIIPDGKVAMAQCTKAKSLKTLEEINQKPIIIAVKPGGTNEHFVNANFDQATVAHTPENVTNIQMIRAQEADMMIANLIEANYFQHQEPERFCVTDDKPFAGTETHQIYMSQSGNVELIDKLNAWLTDDNLKEIAAKWAIKLYLH